jgi:hypothetical protein
VTIARKSRIDAPGARHHIIVRGIERRSIFVDTQDYQEFLERLGNILWDELKSQNWRRVVARSRAVISHVAIDLGLRSVSERIGANARQL